MNLPLQIRKHNSQLGVDIVLLRGAEGRPLMFSTTDPELGGMQFLQPIKYPSTLNADLKNLHESIYHARGREVYRRQQGLCAFCGRQMNGRAETDHIKSRAHGRSDKMSNLRSVCSQMSGGCNGHALRHGQGKTFSIRRQL